MPIPMPYAQVQVQPVAQLMDPAFDQIRRAQASLLTKPVLLPLLFLSLALDLDVDATLMRPADLASYSRTVHIWQVSQEEPRAIPAANPALYGAAIEGGYKPNAYLTDYHDPYGSLTQTSHGGNIWEGGSLARFGLGQKDGNLTHTMHPHIKLLAALEQQHLAITTHGGVALH
jgi:hypothetical protein